MKYHSKRKEHKEIRSIISDSGGIDYTIEKINYFSNKAIDELSVFQDSKYKNFLIDMIKFNMSREN